MIRRSLLVVLALAAPAQAETAPAAADRTPEMAAGAARVATAATALRAAETARDPVPALARALPVYQAALAELRAAVTSADQRAHALTIQLSTRQDEIARLLGALEAMSRTPPPSPALHPQGPLAAARAQSILERLRPALEAETKALSAQLAEREAAIRQHGVGEADLAAGLATLNQGQQALAAALAPLDPGADPAAGQGTPDSTSTAGSATHQAASLTMLARDSENLSQLAAALASANDAPAPPLLASPGPLEWPVQGTVARHFNEPDASGARRPGIVVSAPPLAIVTAPADATVRYAGPFLEYGYVVVLEPDAQTMLVLAGLSRLRVRTGDTVHAGEFLGLLGGRALDVEEYVMLPDAETGAGGSETLYIELRRGRGPVDPEPLFGSNG